MSDLHLPPEDKYTILRSDGAERTGHVLSSFRTISLSGAILMVSLGFQMALQRNWLNQLPDWVVFALFVLSLFPFGYWFLSHDKILQRGADAFKTSFKISCLVSFIALVIVGTSVYSMFSFLWIKVHGNSNIFTSIPSVDQARVEIKGIQFVPFVKENRHGYAYFNVSYENVGMLPITSFSRNYTYILSERPLSEIERLSHQDVLLRDKLIPPEKGVELYRDKVLSFSFPDEKPEDDDLDRATTLIPAKKGFLYVFLVFRYRDRSMPRGVVGVTEACTAFVDSFIASVYDCGRQRSYLEMIDATAGPSTSGHARIAIKTGDARSDPPIRVGDNPAISLEYENYGESAATETLLSFGLDVVSHPLSPGEEHLVWEQSALHGRYSPAGILAPRSLPIYRTVAAPPLDQKQVNGLKSGTMQLCVTARALWKDSTGAYARYLFTCLYREGGKGALQWHVQGADHNKEERRPYGPVTLTKP